MRSQVHIYSVDREHEIVFMEDLGGPFMSITNNAKQVLAYVKKYYGSSYRLVYCDTEGLWWEIVENKSNYWMGTMIGFEPWNGLVWDILKQESQ